MEKVVFTHDNSQIITDDSCCLDNTELMNLNVITIPHQATINEAKNLLKNALRKKEFVLFVGTAQSLSDINDTVKEAAEILDEKDKSLNAKERVKVFNTSSFSGGLGLFVTLFSEFMNSERTEDEADGYSVFLANHIAHFFIEPSEKRWNKLIYVPRTGDINFNGGKFRGNKGVYDYLAGNFRDNAYHQEEEIWVCYSGEKNEAKSLAKHLKHQCPESKIDLSHQIAPNTVSEELPDEMVSCFFLSRDVRPDEPDYDQGNMHFEEIEEKKQLAKKNITAISKYGQAFLKNPNPTF